MIDTRQALGKRPPYTNQNGTETLPVKGKNTKRQDYEGVYTSLIPQVNYTEGPAHNSLPSSVRTLLQGPRPLDYTPQTYASSDPPAYNGAPHTRKRPPEDNPQSFSKEQKNG